MADPSFFPEDDIESIDGLSLKPGDAGVILSRTMPDGAMFQRIYVWQGGDRAEKTKEAWAKFEDAYARAVAARQERLH